MNYFAVPSNEGDKRVHWIQELFNKRLKNVQWHPDSGKHEVQRFADAQYYVNNAKYARVMQKTLELALKPHGILPPLRHMILRYLLDDVGFRVWPWGAVPTLTMDCVDPNDGQHVFALVLSPSASASWQPIVAAFISCGYYEPSKRLLMALYFKPSTKERAAEGWCTRHGIWCEDVLRKSVFGVLELKKGTKLHAPNGDSCITPMPLRRRKRIDYQELLGCSAKKSKDGSSSSSSSLPHPRCECYFCSTCCFMDSLDED